MTLALIFVALAGLLILYKLLEGSVRRLLGWQKKAEERISSLEVDTFKQTARLDRHTSFMKRIRRDVNVLGHDVGWQDDLHKTQTIEKTPPDKPEE